MKNNFILKSILPVAIWLLSFPAFSKIVLPEIFSDYMVLQQQTEAPIWGKATINKSVKLVTSWDNKIYTVVSDSKGDWMIKVKTPSAGGPYSISISDGKELILKNILIGEVWICSGQSNMEMPLAGWGKVLNYEEEIAAANYPNIRLLHIKRATSTKPESNVVTVSNGWQACSPTSIPEFSSVGYFFGRELYSKLNIPIGLINTTWGGTIAEAWTSGESLNLMPDFREAVKNIREDDPVMPQNANNPNRATVLYNAMIYPLIPFAFQGVIWYQGESNADRAYQYRDLFPLLIHDWRKSWNRDFPFYFVQLANYMRRDSVPVESRWAELREAQLKTLNFKNTGMAVSIDIGDALDIHPKNKQDVGKRLAFIAQANTYGLPVVFSGPVFESYTIEGSKIRIKFKHADNGLKPNDGRSVTGFAIAGPDYKFQWANAVIDGNTVIVNSPDIFFPVAVRYGWANNPDCNLYNGANLPASPFRTDDQKRIYISADNDNPVPAGWGVIKRLTARSMENNSEVQVTWSSSNERVAKVRNGYVSAIAEGTAVITAQTDDRKVATYSITVSPTPRPNLGDGARKIRIEGPKLVAGPDKKQLFLNGTNTSWFTQWGGFGNSNWDYEAWDKHFAELHEAGINISRVWFVCDGRTEMLHDEKGYCVGMKSEFWNNVDKLFEIAARHEIYIEATMCTHNCFLSSSPNADFWYQFRDDNNYMDSYINNYLIPFINRYGSSDYLGYIDLMNEPNEASRQRTSQNRIEWRKFFARSAVALHKASEAGVKEGRFIDQIPLTVGVNVAAHIVEGPLNYTSDANLSAEVSPADAKYARIDIYEIHYYPLWNETQLAPFYGNPCIQSPVQYGFPDAANRPAAIGESASKGTGYKGLNRRGSEWKQSTIFTDRSIVEDYVDCMKNGWSGYLGWTSFNCDGFGTLTDQAPATLYMVKYYPELVFPVDTKVTICKGLFDSLPVNTGDKPTLSPPENFHKYDFKDITNGHLKGKRIKNGHEF